MAIPYKNREDRIGGQKVFYVQEPHRVLLSFTRGMASAWLE